MYPREEFTAASPQNEAILFPSRRRSVHDTFSVEEFAVEPDPPAKATRPLLRIPQPKSQISRRQASLSTKSKPPWTHDGAPLRGVMKMGAPTTFHEDGHNGAVSPVSPQQWATRWCTSSPSVSPTHSISPPPSPLRGGPSAEAISQSFKKSFNKYMEDPKAQDASFQCVGAVDVQHVLSRHKLFADCTTVELRALSRLAARSQRLVPRWHVIYREGLPAADGLYLLMHGSVSLARRSTTTVRRPAAT